MGHHPGVDERRQRTGTVYRARVRRDARTFARTFTTLPAALAWRAEMLQAVRDGAEPPPPAPPPMPERWESAILAEAARALCRGIVAGTVRSRGGTPFKPSVARKYESMLRLHVLPAIGGLPLATLRKRDVQRFVDDLAARESAETARKALTALRVALRLAERDGLVDLNPCSGVRVPADSDGERPARTLSPEEAAAIVAAADADDARLGRSLGGPLFALAFGTGLRSGELLALRWGADGLDLDAGVVRVRRSLDRLRATAGAFAEVAPKSRASRRDVPLAPADAARLRRHRLATGRPPDRALVFADEDGRHLNATGVVRHAWRRAVRDAGIALPLPRIHDARHAWATSMLAAGIGAQAVTRLGGWSDAALVHRRYGHALPDELAGAGEALERFREARLAARIGPSLVPAGKGSR